MAADRGYINLLRHLHRPTSTLSLPTLQASIAHYLAHLEPSPTPLSAAVLSSPLFRALTHSKLDALATAFRHGAHIKVQLLQGAPGGLFVRSVPARAAEWVRAVRCGFEGGAALLRLVCAGGLLLGLGDLEEVLHVRERSVRREVEEEVVLALAEVIDAYANENASAGWERDFQRESEGEEPLALAMLMSAQFAPLISAHRLKALPLPLVADLLTSTVVSAFQDGTFLSNADASCSQDAAGQVAIVSTSSFAQTVNALASSSLLGSMAPLSRFCAQALSVAAESRPLHGWPAMAQTMRRLESLTSTLETDWAKTPLAALTDDNQLAPESRELATALWTMLKTLLFTTIMISQSVLSTVVFVPSPPTSSATSSSPSTIALIALHTLSHLSFVMPQFGGVASTSEGGFTELKRAFYMALDILSACASDSERFVLELCDSFKAEALARGPAAFLHAKKAFALASIEQLVPVLSDDCVRMDVYPLCLPHLSDSSHRETYESAHSVMLAIFASHARKTGEQNERAPTSPAFAEQIVPFYTQCLIDNAHDSKLSTAQLCLAYAALVRSASTFVSRGEADASGHTEGDVIAWFCIETLLAAIRNASAAAPSSSTSSSPGSAEHTHRLHLTLIATLPALSLALLPRVLEEVAEIVVGCPLTGDAAGRQADLVRALFRELAENVGDAEKEFAMRWWHENRDRLGGTQGLERPPVDGPEVIARL